MPRSEQQDADQHPVNEHQSPGCLHWTGSALCLIGLQLIEESAFVKIGCELDDYLAQLPDADRPTWTLEIELLADGPSSQASGAAISQPLCTAIQIALVELLHLANVRLGVVDHSSGELGAASGCVRFCARTSPPYGHQPIIPCRLNPLAYRPVSHD
ncbi:uncharacterized protein BDW70DRAFT_165193 [Aspergillus foveolatus]|uniref:uncharacterized protein n=1 Tax=Aspergillus foveolatus TaxID=210207 RepID=UPI003CCC9D62